MNKTSKKRMIKISIISGMLLGGAITFAGEAEIKPFDFAALPGDLKGVVLSHMDSESFRAMGCVNKETNKIVEINAPQYSRKLYFEKEALLNDVQPLKRKYDGLYWSQGGFISPEQEKKRHRIAAQHSNGVYNFGLAQECYTNDDHMGTIYFASKVLKNVDEISEESMLLEDKYE